MTISHQKKQAIEDARRSNGEFGEQSLPEPEGSLTDGDPTGVAAVGARMDELVAGLSFAEKRALYLNLVNIIELDAIDRIRKLALEDHPNAAYLELVEMGDDGLVFEAGALLDADGNTIVEGWDDDRLTEWVTRYGPRPLVPTSELTRLGHQPLCGWDLLPLRA